MPTQLSLASKPYKSSHLAIPPSPFSPKFPIVRPGSPPPAQRKRSRPRIEMPPPPPDPMNWLWQCHLCNRVYQLGVTRRCLDDGHYFCAGTTTVKRSKRTGNKKTIRHKACASEFDYQAWKAWGTWRRDVAEQIAAAAALEEFLNDQPMSLTVPTLPEEGRWLKGTWTRKVVSGKSTRDFRGKDCWNTCDYPSECRWGKQYGVQTPVVSSTPAAVPVPSSTGLVPLPESEKEIKTSFDDNLLDVSPAIEDSPSIEENEHPTQISPTSRDLEEGTKKPSMDDLLESAKRRKRRSAGQLPSPLASNPPSPTESGFPESAAQTLQRSIDDFDIEIRKTFGRAAEVVSSVRRSAALEDEKAEAFVAGLKSSRKKFLGMW